MAALNDKQKRFIDEYMVDLCATQAAIRAGYSPRTAGVQAGDLLKKPLIFDEIQRRKAERSATTGITVERVLEGMANIGFNSRNETVKQRALESLMKHLGLMSDRVSVSMDMPHITIGVLPDEPKET